MIDFLKTIYAFFWRNTSGRPWTYEIRDWVGRHPFWGWLIVCFVVAAGIASQVLSVMTFDLYALPVIIFMDFLAYVGGHLFWDTEGKYVQPHEPGQHHRF